MSLIGFNILEVDPAYLRQVAIEIENAIDSKVSSEKKQSMFKAAEDFNKVMDGTVPYREFVYYVTVNGAIAFLKTFTETDDDIVDVLNSHLKALRECAFQEDNMELLSEMTEKLPSSVNEVNSDAAKKSELRAKYIEFFANALAFASNFDEIPYAKESPTKEDHEQLEVIRADAQAFIQKVISDLKGKTGPAIDEEQTSTVIPFGRREVK